MRWWFGEADEKECNCTGRIHVLDISLAFALVAGEILLWLALAAVGILHYVT